MFFLSADWERHNGGVLDVVLDLLSFGRFPIYGDVLRDIYEDFINRLWRKKNILVNESSMRLILRSRPGH